MSGLFDPDPDPPPAGSSEGEGPRWGPHLHAAIAKAQGASKHAATAWARALPSGAIDREASDEAPQCARQALARLRAGAWDEAEVLGQHTIEADEAAYNGECWREFAILIEEAVALGREG